MSNKQEDTILDNLKLMLTSQILLVLIIDYFLTLFESTSVELDAINYMFPIAFIFFSIVIAKLNNDKFEKCGLLDFCVYTYLVSFGTLIISLYFNLHEISEATMSVLYLISLNLVYFIPIIIFFILVMCTIICCHKNKCCCLKNELTKIFILNCKKTLDQ